MTRSDELIKSNTQAQLIEMATRLGIDAKKSWTKLQIANIIIDRENNLIITENECKSSSKYKKSDITKLAKSKGISTKDSTREEICEELIEADESKISKSPRKKSKKSSSKSFKKSASKSSKKLPKKSPKKSRTSRSSDEPEDPNNLESYSKKQLRDELNRRDIHCSSSMKKDEMIDLLLTVPPVVNEEIIRSAPDFMGSVAPIIIPSGSGSSGSASDSKPRIAPCENEQYAKYAHKTDDELDMDLENVGIKRGKPYDKAEKIRYICAAEENKVCDPENNKYCDDDYVCDVSNDKGICIPKELANDRKSNLLTYAIDGKIIIGVQEAIDELKNGYFKDNANFKQIVSASNPKYAEGTTIAVVETDEVEKPTEPKPEIVSSDTDLLNILKELQPGDESTELSDMTKTQQAALKCLGLMS